MIDGPDAAGEGASGDPTYYDRPVLKEPVWIWAVPAYFYAGGAAGAAATLGAAAQAIDSRGLEGLIRWCRWIAAAGTAAGTGLLIHDLGRPERFLNMLRVFRPTSALNIGSWVLAIATPMAAASALPLRRGGAAGRMANAAGLLSGITGLPLVGYTGVLLSNTAVPVWQESRRALPPLFVASAVSSAASLLALMSLAPEEHLVVRRFGVLGNLAELGAAAAFESQASRVERVGRPLREGLSGSLWTWAKAMTATSLCVSILPAGGRRLRLLSGLLGTAGGILLRFAVVSAGKASTRDPRATFHMQRADRPEGLPPGP
ncbi:MAG: polysulfide reductase NrfD [Actinobacteria bacterium]|nr:polysulfide reductase NrfD [Actinomycetota bacterium]